MAITSTTTGYGPPALDALAATISGLKQGDPLAPVSVIVPNNYVGLATRRALGREGLAAVSFLTVYRLAELLGAAAVAATGHRPVSTPVIAGAVRAVLADDPGRFAGVERHPATERALVRAHRELSEVDEAGQRRLAAESARAADVVRIHRGVSSVLAERFSNEQDLVGAAIEAMATGPPALTSAGPVILHLPQRLTSSQVRLLAALAEHTDVHVIAGLTGVESADRGVIKALERLGIGTAAGAESGPTPALPARALSVSDADDEVRHAVREMVDAARAGVALGRCAILYGTPEPYARLVADALDAAGIPWFGASVRSADTSLLGRSLLALLALDDNDLARRDVAAWLAAAPIRGPDNRPAPTAAWERISRRAGIVSGRDQWLDRLARHADDLDAEADELERDDEHSWRATGNRREAERARGLSEFVDKLADDLEPGGRSRRWSDLATWCRQLMRTYIGGEGLRQAWPEDERRAADRVEAAIDRLADLDSIDPEPSVGAFRRALELQLEGERARQGAFGSGVLVGPVGLGVGVELDRVVLIGLAEGTFPARSHDDALLPDRERRTVEPDLDLRSDRTAEDHRHLLAVLAAASESVMSYPRGDLRRGAERAPSRWLLDAAEARDGVRPSTDSLAHATGDWLDEVPSFVAAIRTIDFPAHEQEYDMRALLADVDAGADPVANALVRQRTEVHRGMDLVVGRGSRRFTRFDGNLVGDGDLRGVRLPSPTDEETIVSATRLETWAACPHAYFVRYVLGVDSLEVPEREYRITPLVRGDLVHRALDRWISEAIDDDDLPPAGRPWSTTRRDRLLAIGEEECDRVAARGLAGRPLYWSGDRRRILADLAATVDFDDERRRESSATPIATELGFGLPGSRHGPVSVALPDGRTIRIRGSIDRVDQAGDDLLIIDYKTGRSDGYKGLSAETPTAGGGHLQLVLYAAAARAILDRTGAVARGAYWFVSTRGKFVVHGYEVTPSVAARVLGLVGSISDGIATGLFPRHPEAPGWRNHVPCWFCEPDGLGTRDQRREWERKRDDPAMGPYLAIGDPDVLHHPGSTGG